MKTITREDARKLWILGLERSDITTARRCSNAYLEDKSKRYSYLLDLGFIRDTSRLCSSDKVIFYIGLPSIDQFIPLKPKEESPGIAIKLMRGYSVAKSESYDEFTDVNYTLSYSTKTGIKDVRGVLMESGQRYSNNGDSAARFVEEIVRSRKRLIHFFREAYLVRNERASLVSHVLLEGIKGFSEIRDFFNDEGNFQVYLSNCSDKNLLSSLRRTTYPGELLIVKQTQGKKQVLCRRITGDKNREPGDYSLLLCQAAEGRIQRVVEAGMRMNFNGIKDFSVEECEPFIREMSLEPEEKKEEVLVQLYSRDRGKDRILNPIIFDNSEWFRVVPYFLSEVHRLESLGHSLYGDLNPELIRALSDFGNADPDTFTQKTRNLLENIIAKL